MGRGLAGVQEEKSEEGKESELAGQLVLKSELVGKSESLVEESVAEGRRSKGAELELWVSELVPW
jgi:hypothetical protein